MKRLIIGSDATNPSRGPHEGLRNNVTEPEVFPVLFVKKRGGAKAVSLWTMVLILCSVFVILSFSKAAFAGTIRLPQSGQTKCYDTSGTEIPCAGTGQDGDKEMGVAWSSNISNVRFAIGTGAQVDCVTDYLTGLMWVKTPDNTTRTWQTALDYVTGLNLCGFSDWRVPTYIELQGMLSDEQPNSADWLNTQGFNNVHPDMYWSSTTYAVNARGAMGVYMSNPLGNFYDTKTNNHYVWPVRGGQ